MRNELPQMNAVQRKALDLIIRASIKLGIEPNVMIGGKVYSIRTGYSDCREEDAPQWLKDRIVNIGK